MDLFIKSEEEIKLKLFYFLMILKTTRLRFGTKNNPNHLWNDDQLRGYLLEVPFI